MPKPKPIIEPTPAGAEKRAPPSSKLTPEEIRALLEVHSMAQPKAPRWKIPSALVVLGLSVASLLLDFLPVSASVLALVFALAWLGYGVWKTRPPAGW